MQSVATHDKNRVCWLYIPGDVTRQRNSKKTKKRNKNKNKKTRFYYFSYSGLWSRNNVPGWPARRCLEVWTVARRTTARRHRSGSRTRSTCTANTNTKAGQDACQNKKQKTVRTHKTTKARKHRLFVWVLTGYTVQYQRRSCQQTTRQTRWHKKKVMPHSNEYTYTHTHTQYGTQNSATPPREQKTRRGLTKKGSQNVSQPPNHTATSVASCLCGLYRCVPTTGFHGKNCQGDYFLSCCRMPSYNSK